MTAGTCISCIGMTEPDAGSDLQGVRTRAVRDGDDWIINGSKTYITNGWLADVVVVVALTEPTAEKKAHGITLFIVDADNPGLKKVVFQFPVVVFQFSSISHFPFIQGQKLKKLGLKYQDTAELFFEDCRVPSSAILGGLNQGFYKLMTELPQERLSIGVAGAAHCEWMFEETRNFIRNRSGWVCYESNTL